MAKTLTLEQRQMVLQAVETWPEDRQDAAAELLERLHELAISPYKLSDEELADIEEGLAQARRGESATDAEMAAMFRRFGL